MDCCTDSLGSSMRRSAQYLSLLFGLFLLALFPTDQALAQADTVEYGFIRDSNEPTRIIAVAFPNGDFVDASFALNQGTLFSFYLPAGTIDESTPHDLISDLAVTPSNDTEWHVEVYTDSWMDTLGLDTGDRDLYRFSLNNTLAGKNASDPFPLFSFSLPAGCSGGSAQIVAGDDAFSAALLTTQGISLRNSFSVIAPSATDPTDFYGGNDTEAGAIPCEENITLAITLSYFHAQRENEKRVFSWETATEAASAGFNLLAEDELGLTRLNPELIPSTVTDSLAPTAYRFTADTAATLFYLDEVGIYGKTKRNGPYALGRAYGISTASKPDAAEAAVYLPMIHR